MNFAKIIYLSANSALHRDIIQNLHNSFSSQLLYITNGSNIKDYLLYKSEPILILHNYFNTNIHFQSDLLLKLKYGEKICITRYQDQFGNHSIYLNPAVVFVITQYPFPYSEDIDCNTVHLIPDFLYFLFKDIAYIVDIVSNPFNLGSYSRRYHKQILTDRKIQVSLDSNSPLNIHHLLVKHKTCSHRIYQNVQTNANNALSSWTTKNW